MQNHDLDAHRRDVALFRLAVLGDLIHQDLLRGELGPALAAKAAKTWRTPDGRERRVAAKTIRNWLHLHRKDGFDGLIPRKRKDRGSSRSISADISALILDMKREDPGRSAPLILKELLDAGRIQRRAFSVSSVQRLIERSGLSGPQMELEVPARHRFRASVTGELWQVDAVHGPKLFDPASGRETRVKIFGLLDDRSRLVSFLRGSFHERQEDFLRTLFEAVRRRGVPRCLLLDNHGSFTGSDVRVVCARLGIRLAFARPRDGASKGKIERFWRTLRGHVLGRIAPGSVATVEELNLRLMTWVDADYNVRPHAGINGRTPLSVYEEDIESVRFCTDHEALTSHFVVNVVRVVRNDATCTIDGRCFEVPQHLRRNSVKLYYAVLRPETVWIEDGGACVFVREVEPTENFRRARIREERPLQDKPRTGLNAVDAMLASALHPGPCRPHEPGDEELVDEPSRARQADDENEGGVPCMPF